MKDKLPSLLLVSGLLAALAVWTQPRLPFGWAQESPSTTEVAPTTAASNNKSPAPADLLSHAITQLDRRSSVAARVRHRTNWFGQKLLGSGRYLQGPPDQRQVRLELRTPLVDKVSSLQQVCDGKTLWTYEYSYIGRSLGRVNVEQAVQTLQASPAAAAAPMKVLAVGGAPQLLRSLQTSFEFTTVEKRVLGDLPAWVLRGKWTKPYLLVLLPDQKEKIEAGQQLDYSPLPPQLPDNVVLWLGRDDLFPYRFEFRRQDGSEFLKKRDEAKELPESSMIFEFFEVQFDAAIDPKEFQYDPGPMGAEDRTAGFLKRLGM